MSRERDSPEGERVSRDRDSPEAEGVSRERLAEGERMSRERRRSSSRQGGAGTGGMRKQRIEGLRDNFIVRSVRTDRVDRADRLAVRHLHGARQVDLAVPSKILAIKAITPKANRWGLYQRL